LDADFLTFYGINIHTATVDELGGPRFFALARRVFAYEGVMQVRARQEEEDAPRRTPSRPTGTPQQQIAQPASSNNVVELAAFRASFPGLVSHNTEGR
jgi:hypothetical protein